MNGNDEIGLGPSSAGSGWVRTRTGGGRTRLLAVATVVGVLLLGPLGLIGAGEAHAVEGSLADDGLAACINTKLGRAASTVITESEISGITGSLSCAGLGITTLEGLQFATGITSLSLNTNRITDVSPLSGLTQLTVLNLGTNQIADLSPLAGLTNLTQLRVDYNAVSLSDVSPLAGMTKLVTLNVNLSSVSDLTPLSGLNSLKNLTVNNSEVVDVSPLKNLPALQDVALSGNKIIDISPLAEVSTLTTLRIAYNEIGDLSAFHAAVPTAYAIAQTPVISEDVRYVPVGLTSYRTELNWAPKSWGGVETNAASLLLIDSGEGFAGVEREYAVTDTGYLRAPFAAPLGSHNFSGLAYVPIVRSEFTSNAPTQATVDAAYSFAFTVTDGFPVAQWSVTEGRLPAGLALSDTGVLEGVPAAEGEYEFAVTASDTWGNQLTNNVTFAVETSDDDASRPTGVPDSQPKLIPDDVSDPGAPPESEPTSSFSPNQLAPESQLAVLVEGIDTASNDEQDAETEEATASQTQDELADAAGLVQNPNESSPSVTVTLKSEPLKATRGIPAFGATAAAFGVAAIGANLFVRRRLL